MTSRGRSRGFTLMEVLVAIAIFTVVGVLALSGYNELVQQNDRAAEGMERTRALQRTVMRLTQDLEQLEPRSVRDPLGQSEEAALLADPRSTALLQLTRAGWSNPAGLPRGTLQRVLYRLDDGKLYRDYWAALDHTMAVQPVQVELIDQVRSVTLRYMNANRQWQDQWPPATSGVPDATFTRLRPIAVEITLELEDWGAIRRVVELPG